MFARGRQAYIGDTPKQAYLKQHPNAACHRVYYLGFGTLYALYQDKKDEKPLLIRKTAEDAYQDALAGATH